MLFQTIVSTKEGEKQQNKTAAFLLLTASKNGILALIYTLRIGNPPEKMDPSLLR